VVSTVLLVATVLMAAVLVASPVIATTPVSATEVDHRGRGIIHGGRVNHRRCVSSKNEGTDADIDADVRACGRACRNDERGKNQEKSLFHE
jgi:hypothetical protein